MLGMQLTIVVEAVWGEVHVGEMIGHVGESFGFWKKNDNVLQNSAQE